MPPKLNIMKESILQKANTMFLTLGYKSVTMDDIATELGISKKTIYQHYANKNDLVEASVSHLFETITNGIDTIRTERYNSIQEMFEVRKFLERTLNNETASPLYQLQKFFPAIHVCLRKKNFEKLHESMLDNITRGINDGTFRDNIDIEFTARMYFTGITGIKDTEIFPIDEFEPGKLAKKLIEYHLRSITTHKGLEMLEYNLTKY